MANYGTVIIKYKFVTSVRGNGVSFLTNLSLVGAKWRERTWRLCRLCAMSRNSDSKGWHSYFQ